MNLGDMNFYPILIPTLCRYEHFRRCVESLSRCTHADKTELIIGLDYPASETHWDGYYRINKYIPTITGFKKVKCLKREINFGASGNYVDLREYAFTYNDAAIITEDDNEFSPCFLDFMNKALEKYRDDERVMSVSGYLAMDFEGFKSKGVVYSHDNNAWGVGFWKEKEEKYRQISYQYFVDAWKSPYKFTKIFMTSPGIANMFNAMLLQNALWGDVMRSVYNILNNTYQVRPYTSMVRNWGYDGSGIHCTAIVPEMAKQRIIKSPVFDFATGNNDCKLPHSLQFFLHIGENNIRSWIYIVRSYLYYWKNRIKCVLLRCNGK